MTQSIALTLAGLATAVALHALRGAQPRLAAAARNRVASVALVCAIVGAANAIETDPHARGRLLYAGVLTLGYGHLLGAWLTTRRKVGIARGPDAALRSAFNWVGMAFAFGLYAGGLPHSAGPLLLLSVWHTLENDRRLGEILASGSAPPLSRSPERHARLLGMAALPVVALYAAGDAIQFADAFAAATLYHLVSWLLVFHSRIRHAAPRRASQLRRRLAWVHALPAACCAVLLLDPRETLTHLADLAFSPSIYLFWSALHVAQTARARGITRAPSHLDLGKGA